MPTVTQERPQYKSNAYYDVVIRSGEYLGWRCVFAGDGGMSFRHSDGRERHFEGGPGQGWMCKCWDAFTEFAATQSKETKDHYSIDGCKFKVSVITDSRVPDK